MKFRKQISESLHEANNSFDIKQRANMLAIEFTDLYPILEALDNPNFIREKSTIVSSLSYYVFFSRFFFNVFILFAFKKLSWLFALKLSA